MALMSIADEANLRWVEDLETGVLDRRSDTLLHEGEEQTVP